MDMKNDIHLLVCFKHTLIPSSSQFFLIVETPVILPLSCLTLPYSLMVRSKMNRTWIGGHRPISIGPIIITKALNTPNLAESSLSVTSPGD